MYATELFPSTPNSEIIEKAIFKTKPHICSYPNCGKEATHSYDMKKHERTHIKNNLKCEWCTYETKDRRNLNATHPYAHGRKTLHLLEMPEKIHVLCTKKAT